MWRYLSFSVIAIFVLNFYGGANTIEIRYHSPQTSKVTLVWGVNGWSIAESMPPGTFIKNKSMRTPMVKEGDDFVIRIFNKDPFKIDYIFELTKSVGPFKIDVKYSDANFNPGAKHYHSFVKGNSAARINGETNTLYWSHSIRLINYATLLLAICALVSLLVFISQKILYKSRSIPVNRTAVFIAIPVSLYLILVSIRVIITGMGEEFIKAPFQVFPVLFTLANQDLLYTAALTLFFGIFFYFFKKRQTAILYLFGGFAIISLLLCLANIQVMDMLGRPFNYQWMYYSDFLNSEDATNALKANVTTETLVAYILMVLSAVLLAWPFYRLSAKRPLMLISILLAFPAFGYLTVKNHHVAVIKRENPVIFFLRSLTELDDLPQFSEDDSGSGNEFRVKNSNVLPPYYVEKIRNAGIKNVIVFVMESTPAEFLTPYNSSYQTTPYLDSLKSSSAIFDAVYAHVPTTNKSMVSLLCGVFPYLSYKFLTSENPDMKIPSISSELRKSGYRSAFFNSGDNRFRGAGDFLAHRDFDKIEDYRTNPCNTVTFTDPGISMEHLDGISDTCLSVRFFNWLNNEGSTPFFSMMWTYQTHYPYYTTGKTIDFNTHNKSWEKYLNALRESDKTLRNLVEGLKERNLFESTLIVIVGDHGEAFGRHGQTTHGAGIYEENLHIPLLLINPLLFSGEHFKIVGGVSDVAPTIFSILNKQIPPQWQGENLLSINRRQRVYFFNPYSGLLFGCREGDYKFIFNARTNSSSLYNLANDPHESDNIAHQQPDRVKAMKNNVNAWIRYQTEYMTPYLK